MVLCITGRFYTILTKPHIINKTTSGLRVRKNKQQVIHQSRWCFIPNYTQGLLLVPWILHYLNPLRGMNKTTNGFKVRTNDHQVIHRNQRRFIPNYTHRSFFVPLVDFTQFNPTPPYH